MEKIRAIIFDWGGVLIEDPAPGLAEFCANAIDVSVDKFKLAYSIYMDDFLTGRISEQDFWLNITKHLSVPMPKDNCIWGKAFASAYVPRKELFSMAHQYRKAGLKIALLSNTEKPAVKFFKKQNYDIFDVTVFSCMEGIQKPQKEIYRLTLDRLGTSAGQTLFIDDRQDYIVGAKQTGLYTILFNSVEQLKKELVQCGLNVV